MKVFVGTVASAKQNKTVIVEVERDFVHPIYGKRMKRTKKFSCHTELPVNEQDKVEIRETRPMSKNTFFEVVKVLTQKAEEPVKEEKPKKASKPKSKEKKSV